MLIVCRSVKKALCALAHGSGRGVARILHCWIAARNNARSVLKVTIADAAGKTLLDTTSEGPWFLAKLPAGSYQVKATFEGNAVNRKITVDAAKLRTIDFRWSSE